MKLKSIYTSVIAALALTAVAHAAHAQDLSLIHI